MKITSPQIEISLNEPQVKALERINKLARSAHFIDIKFRDNGEDKIVQIDFLREFLTNLTPPQQ